MKHKGGTPPLSHTATGPLLEVVHLEEVGPRIRKELEHRLARRKVLGLAPGHVHRGNDKPAASQGEIPGGLEQEGFRARCSQERCPVFLK